MKPFAIARASSPDQVRKLLNNRNFPLPVLKGGGMDLLDLLKEGLLATDLLVDVRSLRTVEAPDGIAVGKNDGDDKNGTTLSIDATTTLAEIAVSPVVARHAPGLGDCAASAATPQVRNVATAAGNLMQRPRCWYFRNRDFDCLKKGGFQCFAAEGENKYHAVFSEGPCYIVHPSNLAPVLHVCDARVHVTGGERNWIAISDFYHTPDQGIRDEANLKPGELITHLSLRAEPNGAFYAIKEKQSFDWPLVMAAAAVEMDGVRIVSARLCAGAVAPIPWPLPQVEEALRGVRIDDEMAFGAACDLASGGAHPLAQNEYKLRLLPVAVRRAILRAAARAMEAKR